MVGDGGMPKPPADRGRIPGFPSRSENAILWAVAETPTQRPARRKRRWPIRFAKLSFIVFAAFAGGFAAFVTTLPLPPREAPLAEGIVVLTGGDDRIDAALALLETGHGSRLLISGLHESTTRAALRKMYPAAETAFDCCVDLGWYAQNTPGNAAEAAQWAKAKGFHSVIVVTASYHMPRALLELGSQMEGIQLVPYPVMPNALTKHGAWRDPATIKLMASEYFKYVAAQARIGGSKLLAMTGL